MTSNFRQHPGSACEECRRRKARCDRSRPSCSGCSELGKVCIFNDQRAQRGPQKGQIRALRDRVGTNGTYPRQSIFISNHLFTDFLERLLSEQQQSGKSFATGIDPAGTAPQLTDSPGITSTEIPPLWGFDMGLPMTVEPLLTDMTEMTEQPYQASLASKGNWKIAQFSDEGPMPALVRDDVYVIFEISYIGY